MALTLPAAALGLLLAVPTQPIRPNLAIILDSSGSMTWSLSPESVQTLTCSGGSTLTDVMGTNTWGDGSARYPGLDVDGNGKADDSRMFIAKGAVTALVNGLPGVNLAFLRYHQDEGLGINGPDGSGCENWYRR